MRTGCKEIGMSKYLNWAAGKNHKGRLKKTRHLPYLKYVCNFLSVLSALQLHILLQLHIQINRLELNLLFGALGMVMGPHQLTKAKQRSNRSSLPKK